MKIPASLPRLNCFCYHHDPNDAFSLWADYTAEMAA